MQAWTECRIAVGIRVSVRADDIDSLEVSQVIKDLNGGHTFQIEREHNQIWIYCASNVKGRL
jgi:hypothetical protein